MRRHWAAASSNMADKHIIINIGRRFGSGGLGVARELSKRLDIPVYDSELITAAAKSSGLGEEQFRGRDEKRRFWGIGSLFGSNRYGMVNEGLNDAQIFKIQSETIRRIAQEGSAIFVGRASNYVLRDMDCLDVFITASMKTRVARVAEREGMPPADAEAYIRKQDKERESYYNFFTFGNWGDSADYDLCVDSDILGIEKTSELIIEFGRQAGLL